MSTNNPDPTIPPQRPEPQTAPPEVEPIKPDKGDRDAPPESFPTSPSYTQFFKPQTPYEKYLSEPDDGWE